MIKLDMEMPKCCEDCFALDDYGDYPMCRINGHSRGYNFDIRNKRMPDCPMSSTETLQDHFNSQHMVITDHIGDFNPCDFGIPQGWQCPVCKRVYSPTTPWCYFCGSSETTTTTNTDKWVIFDKSMHTHENSDEEE